ncbi:hypothetical protein ACP4OV_018025 [Aristida adscensionis]
MEIIHRGGAIALSAVAVTLLLLLLPPPFVAAATAPAAAVAAAANLGPGSNCTRWCGNISIPYPFGVEPGCYHAAGFNLTCRDSLRGNGLPPQLFLGDGTVQVLDISVPNATVRINSQPVDDDDDDDDDDNDDGDDNNDDGFTANRTWGGGLPRAGPYFLSEVTNSVAVVGCGVRVDLRGGARNDLIGSCTAVCPPVPQQSGAAVPRFSDGCIGVGCCQATIVIVDNGLKYIKPSWSDETLPAMLDWVISNSTCPMNTSAPECRSAHSFCQDSFAEGHRGYVCQCTHGYQGNPYVAGGCQDIDECKSPDIYLCYGQCRNTPGSFICQCPAGYIGNASVLNGCKDIDECEDAEAHSCYGVCLNFPGSFHCQCHNGTYGNPLKIGGCIAIKNSFTGLTIGLGVGVGTFLLFLALGGPFILRKIKLQKVKNVKQKFFNQNHGLLLQQLISRNTDIGERMIITLSELEKATDNFDRARVVGGGGHGIVFKGILNLHVVAIKKSKIVVQREIDEFINEVVVLSQVNHRNVVKLLGCCLETEVPLLVYEFISNGTLHHHCHTPWMNAGFRFVGASDGVEVEGYPSLLRAMMWRANFSFEPRYSFYARGTGLGLVDYRANLSIAPRFMPGSQELQFVEWGSSVEMAMQKVAYAAMVYLRHALPELARGPFEYFPSRAPGELVSEVVAVPPTAPYLVRYLVELVRAQDRIIRCLDYELGVTRSSFRRMQVDLEPFVRWGRVRRQVVYGGPRETVHELATPEFRFPSDGGFVAPPFIPLGVRMSTSSLPVRRFPIHTATAETLLGPRVWLSHLDVPDDCGGPSAHGMVEFPADFVRPPFAE